MAGGATLRVLLVTWEGGGNVPPLVVLGSRLADRGHDVRALGPAALAGRFGSAGIRFVSHRSPAEWTGLEPFTWSGLDDGQSADLLRGLAADVRDELRREPADVAVVDYMQPDALCATEAAGVPTVAFVHTLHTRVARGPRSPIQMMTDTDGINRLRAEMGLEPVGHITDLLGRAALTVVATTEALDRPEGRSPRVVHAGPLVEAPGDDAGWQPPGAPDDDRPLVVVSLGTTDMDEGPVLARVLEALRALPVRVAATVGDHLDPAAFDAGPHGVVCRYVRHAAVLPHAALLVGHAGLGTISAAMVHGVPVLCLPLGRDQPDNADHVEAAGLGRQLPADADAGTVAAAVEDLLAAGTERAAARGVAAAVAASDAADRALDAIERTAQR